MSILAGTYFLIYIKKLDFYINIFVTGVFPQQHCIDLVVLKVVATSVFHCLEGFICKENKTVFVSQTWTGVAGKL